MHPSAFELTIDSELLQEQNPIIDKVVKMIKRAFFMNRVKKNLTRKIKKDRLHIVNQYGRIR